MGQDLGLMGRRGQGELVEPGARSAVEGVACRAVMVGLLLRERRVEQAVPAVAVRGVML